jgi:hypothetical protein
MAQMRRSHEFKDSVLRPSYRRVLILIDGYEAFLRHKEEQRLQKCA